MIVFRVRLERFTCITLVAQGRYRDPPTWDFTTWNSPGQSSSEADDDDGSSELVTSLGLLWLMIFPTCDK